MVELIALIIVITLIVAIVGLIFDCFSTKKEGEGWSIGDVIFRASLALGSLIFFLVVGITAIKFFA